MTISGAAPEGISAVSFSLEAAGDLDAIRAEIVGKGYAVLRRPELRNIIAAAREEYLSSIANNPLHSQAEKFHPEDLRKGPWRKLAIGATNGLGESYAQFLLTTYLHEKSSRFPKLSELFAVLIELRNALTGLRPDFGSVASRDKFWNACRIHHYPKGGGFMSAHRDTHFPAALEGHDLPFLQIMACLSRRGEDFLVGGGFVRDREGSRVSTDKDDSFGSLVLFDGSIVHGVDTVDADTIPDFQATSGRIAAFANLYKVL